MLKSLRLKRLEHVASHAACMTLQHALKVVAFGLLGFAYGPWLPLILAMILTGFVGTLLGRSLLIRTGDDRFHRVLSIVLTLLALRLLWSGLGGLLGSP